MPPPRSRTESLLTLEAVGAVTLRGQPWAVRGPSPAFYTHDRGLNIYILRQARRPPVSRRARDVDTHRNPPPFPHLSLFRGKRNVSMSKGGRRTVTSGHRP